MKALGSSYTTRLGGQTCSKPAHRPSRLRQVTTSVYKQNGMGGAQGGTGGFRNGTGYQSQQLGNTASASNRAALQEQIGATIDVSREAVTTQTVPLAGMRKSYGVSLFDAMKFNGPAPERINGRLAMVGFLLGIIAEFNSAGPLLEQAKANPIPVVLVTIVFSWASLVPITKGARSEAFGIFSPRAEITNGRAAMLGIAALLFLEYSPGVSFF